MVVGRGIRDRSNAAAFPVIDCDGIRRRIFTGTQVPENPSHDLKNLAESYQQALVNAADGKSFVTDKLLSNGFFVGIIRMILPWAKIIHIRRDPLDNALSIYKNYFWEQQTPEFCSLPDIGAYAGLMDKIMTRWKTLLPGFIHDVSYENLVNDPEAERKNVITDTEPEYLAWLAPVGQVANQFDYTIPADLPSGQYELRSVIAGLNRGTDGIAIPFVIKEDCPG